MNIELIKGVLGLVKPEFITNLSLNKKIETLNNHIHYLKAHNRGVEPFADKLEDISYQAEFGLTKAKYEFFYSHADILLHFQHIHLKTISMFTYRDKNNKFIVAMNWADRFLCSLFCFFGLIALVLFILLLFKFKPFNVFDLGELARNKATIIFLLILPFCIGYIFVKFYAPFFLVPRFNRLYSKSK